MLTQTGAFTVIPVADGHAALEALDGNDAIDAILTDLQMPGMDGVSLIGAVLERGLDIPIAVMTGHPIGSPLRDRLKRFGIAASFSKPIDIHEFADELQRALSPATVGQVTGITIFGFLQLFEVEEKTGVVVIRSGDREGRIYFERGNPVHAVHEGLVGAPALYDIVTWAGPRLEMFYNRQARERSITEPLQVLLMEAARRMDESGRGAEPMPSAPPKKPRRLRNVGARLQDGPDASPAPRTVAPHDVLVEVMTLEGALGAAIVDASSGMVLGSIGGSPMLDVELLAAGATDLLRGKLQALAAGGGDDRVEDVMVTTTTQYHILRLSGVDQRIFFHVVLDRQRANLALGRRRVEALAQRLTV